MTAPRPSPHHANLIQARASRDTNKRQTRSGLTWRVQPGQLPSPGVLRPPAGQRAARSRSVLVSVRILLRHGPVPDVGLGEKRRRHVCCPPPRLPSAAGQEPRRCAGVAPSVGRCCSVPRCLRRWLLAGGWGLQQLLLGGLDRRSFVPPGNARSERCRHQNRHLPPSV